MEDSSGRRRTEKEKRGRANCGLELEGRQRLNPRQTWEWGMAQVKRRGRGGSFFSPLQDHFLGLPGRRRNAREDVSSCPIAENRVFYCFYCNPTKQLKIFKPDIFSQVRIRFVIDTHFRPQVLGKKSSLATTGLFFANRPNRPTPPLRKKPTQPNPLPPLALFHFLVFVCQPSIKTVTRILGSQKSERAN